MNRLEALLKDAFRAKKWVVNHKAGKCLDDETIACAIDNKIPKSEEAKVSDHIARCHSCAEKLSNYLLTARDLVKEGQIQPPTFLVDQARSLVAEKITVSDVLDIILDIREKAIELVHTTGERLFGPGLVPALRSQGEVESKNSIHVVKSFDKFTAEVEIDKRVSNSTDLIFRLTEKESNKRAEGIRVSLLKKDREIESLVLQGGKATFEDIAPDSYKVLIIKDDKEIGVVNVTMRLK